MPLTLIDQTADIGNKADPRIYGWTLEEIANAEVDFSRLGLTIKKLKLCLNNQPGNYIVSQSGQPRRRASYVDLNFMVKLIIYEVHK